MLISTAKMMMLKEGEQNKKDQENEQMKMNATTKNNELLFLIHIY